MNFIMLNERHQTTKKDTCCTIPFILRVWKREIYSNRKQIICCLPLWVRGFPCSSVGKESAYNAGDLGSIPGLGRSPGEGTGNPLQYSFLENPMDCSLPGSSVHGVARVRHNLATKPPPSVGGSRD